MNYIDLEDDFPKAEGNYKVKIVGTETREANAHWTNGKGFTLINDTLAPDEYIQSWMPN